ncbi:crotonobetaine/carnitine-CoA ligase [Kibdelosporangium banguiense]|uniref:Crotonobetaine/carnitine-CoA ligase n=1 Tax=Kibdelosporangium banguiense TaxID=1365924 RepID=A0ABS4TUS5_9PSEU|nr:AMP-binding protein [Kibdelosporangium banguiense]MBP2328161.1 crotonobetaine/carnitine-CoA ligase [Kibdelosporangium banguiense]
MGGSTDVPVTWPEDFPQAWTGCPRLPLLQVLCQGFEQFGDRTPLVFDDGYRITSRELRAETEKFAAALATRIGFGDRVALAVGNRAEYVIAFLAVVANRAVVVSLSPEIGSHEAAYVVEDSQCVLAITDESSTAVFQELAGTSPVLKEVIAVRGEEPYGFAHVLGAEPPLNLAAVEADVDDLVDIGYTSGTTGLPKALGGTHPDTLRYIDVFVRSRTAVPGEDRRLLMPLQFHYGDPLVALFTAIYTGATIVLMRRFSVSRFWDVARQTRATEILTIGSIPDMLLSRPESAADRDHSIQGAIALAIPPGRHAELERRFGFPWREAYGSSESGPAIAMPDSAGAEFVGTGALGIPYPGVHARLVDEDGAVVTGTGSGELELAGEVEFPGYLNNPEATAEVLRDGWLRTGDLMRRDERGVYYFAGRRKELIRRSGINIAPTEIETVLRLHPDVLDAAVVPVADAMMGEEVKAYVELVPGAGFDPAALVKFCEQRLSRQKIPRYVEHRTEPFPRTPTQRIPKNQLKVDGEHLTRTAWDRLAGEETTGKFEDLPSMVGTVVRGEPFALGDEESELFHRATWLDKVYPEDPADYPENLVEGFLLLSMLDAVARMAQPAAASQVWGLNYGLDRVRFVSQVHWGDTIVPAFETLDVQPKDVGFKVLRRCTFTVEGHERPAMVADWWTLVLRNGTVEKGRRNG